MNTDKQRQIEDATWMTGIGWMGAILVIIIQILISTTTQAQTIHVTNYQSQADITLYKTPYRSQADFLYWIAPYRSQANRQHNHWYMVDYPSQAEVKIWWTQYPSQATYKVYQVKYPSQTL